MNFAIKLNKNSYYPLNKDFLDISSDDDNLITLEGIDKFNQKYTKEEIIESLIRSNILVQDTKKLELIIFYNDNEKTRELKVYTKDDLEYLEFNTFEYIYDNLNNKNAINQICNYFETKNYIPEDLHKFIIIYKTCSTVQIVNAYDSLCYGSKRLLKDYIYEKLYKRNKEKKLSLDNNIR